MQGVRNASTPSETQHASLSRQAIVWPLACIPVAVQAEQVADTRAANIRDDQAAKGWFLREVMTP